MFEIPNPELEAKKKAAIKLARQRRHKHLLTCAKNRKNRK